MRRPTLLLLALVLGALTVPGPTAPAAASCPAPSLEVVEALVLPRGSTVTVVGHHFAEGCQDVIGCTSRLGCQSCHRPDPPTPSQDVELRLVQGGRSWVLAVADADGGDGLGRVTWTFAVPADAGPGRARLIPDDLHPVGVRVRIGGEAAR